MSENSTPSGARVCVLCRKRKRWSGPHDACLGCRNLDAKIEDLQVEEMTPARVEHARKIGKCAECMKRVPSSTRSWFCRGCAKKRKRAQNLRHRRREEWGAAR